MTKAQRFQLFVERLQAAPPVDSHDEALALISETLIAVENEFSNVPSNPERWRESDRMYPPSPEFSLTHENFVIEYRSLGHSTFINETGAFVILSRRSGESIVSKADSRGRVLIVDRKT